MVPAASIIQNIIFLFCSYYMNSSLLFLCLGNSFAALFGEFPGVIALCYGFIADVTKDQKMSSRISRMAFIDCAINMAGIPAGLFAGQLLKQVGFTAVFGLSIALNVALLAYIIFFIPSSTKPSVQEVISSGNSVEEQPANIETSSEEMNSNIKKESGGKTNGQFSLSNESLSNDLNVKNQISWDLFKPHKQIYLVYKLITGKERRHLILPPLIAFIFIIYGFVGELTITSLYLKSDPLALSPDFVGYYYATQAVIRSLGVVLTTQIATRVFKASDINVLLFGTLSQILCYVLIGFSKEATTVFVSNIIGFGVPVGLSLSRSYTSKHVPSEQVGTLMAAFESIDALSFTTNLISIQVFNATLDKFPGAVFLFLAGCSFVGLCITIGNKIYLSRTTTATAANDMLHSAFNEQNLTDISS